MTESQLNPELAERVRTILRRDLRLGPDAKIDADTPLMGGDFELDSLDMVMLVTSVEKEFGVKLTDSQKSQQAFENVGTLVQFLEKQQQQQGAAATTAPQHDTADNADASTGSAVDFDRLLAGLPHGEPFRFVTRLTDLTPMTRGQGVWALTGQEDFFAGHFPQRPIVPGVLISEALAQLSGLVGAPSPETSTNGQPNEPGQGGELVHVDVRFRRAVAPPAQIVLHSQFDGALDGIQQFEVRAEHDGEVVAEGRLSLKRHAAQGQ